MNSLPKISLALLLLFLAACANNPPLHPQTEISSGELSLLQAAYDVNHYTLHIEVQPDRRFLIGEVEMRAMSLEPLSQIEIDLDPRYSIQTVKINDEIANYTKHGGKLVLSGHDIAANSTFTTSVSYRGRPYIAENPPWDGGFVFTETESGEHWIATAVQGRGCDLYWPCKDHISDKPELGADMHITVPSNLVAVMNGVLVSEATVAGKTTYHWQTTNPISTYHLAINIGPFKTYQLQHKNALTGNNSFPIIFYHVTDDIGKIETLIQDDFTKQLAWFEKTLGPYPWGEEKIGIVEIPYLGMEHQTMNGYGNGFTLDPRGYDWLMQHEFSHEWFGNLMTQDGSRDFWLHEGTAAHMQPLYSREVIGEAGYWHDMWNTYNQIKNCKPVVPDGIVSQSYHDTNDPYYKGSWTLHTLRWLIGDDAFWHSIRRLIYATTDPWSLSYPITPTRRSTEDFIRIASEEYGQDLNWFFDVYIKKKDLPVLSEERLNTGLRLSFDNYPSLNFAMPVKITEANESRMVSIPTDGSLFPLEEKAIVQIDPDTQVFRDFGTLEACTSEL
jgi:aminopeptidase N